MLFRDESLQFILSLTDLLSASYIPNIEISREDVQLSSTYTNRSMKLRLHPSRGYSWVCCMIFSCGTGSVWYADSEPLSFRILPTKATTHTSDPKNGNKTPLKSMVNKSKADAS
uniref:Uncharacterized protein n=1 Tax=Cucumis melo TaxID=3656 RepID=Q5DMV6_CUCME|nr:hypothetical protein [Cucumis melo]